MTNATAHIDAGEWAEAKADLMAAKALLIAMPDGGSDGTTMNWNRDAIDELIQQCDDERRRTSNTSAGFERQSIEHKRITAT